MSTSPNSWARTAAVAVLKGSTEARHHLQYFPSRPQPQLSCFLMLVSFPLRSDSPLCGGDERCEGGASDFSPTVARAGDIRASSAAVEEDIIMTRAGMSTV